eukprot:gene5202-929_t
MVHGPGDLSDDDDDEQFWEPAAAYTSLPDGCPLPLRAPSGWPGHRSCRRLPGAIASCRPVGVGEVASRATLGSVRVAVSRACNRTTRSNMESPSSTTAQLRRSDAVRVQEFAVKYQRQRKTAKAWRLSFGTLLAAFILVSMCLLGTLGYTSFFQPANVFLGQVQVQDLKVDAPGNFTCPPGNCTANLGISLLVYNPNFIKLNLKTLYLNLALVDYAENKSLPFRDPIDDTVAGRVPTVPGWTSREVWWNVTLCFCSWLQYSVGSRLVVTPLHLSQQRYALPYAHQLAICGTPPLLPPPPPPSSLDSIIMTRTDLESDEGLLYS